MKNAYLKIIKKKLAAGQFNWLLQNALKYPLLKRAYQIKRPLCGPLFASIMTTYNCNLDCQFCNLSENVQDYNAFKTEDFKAALSELIHLGTNSFGFTGGEPLLRKDLLDLLVFVKKKSKLVHLSTNGTLLKQDISLQLIETDIDGINISIDGSPSEVLMDNLNNLIRIKQKKASSMIINLVSVITKDNLNKAGQLITLAKKLGVDHIGFIPVHDFRSAENKVDAIDAKKIDAGVDQLITLKKKEDYIDNSVDYLCLFKNSLGGKPSPLKCYAGYTSIVLDCYGNIFPCFPYALCQRHYIDNLNQRALKEIYYSQQYARKRQITDNCHLCYWNCHTELNLLFN